MRLLFLDFEATGVDPKTARPIEFCFRGWDTVTGEKVLSHGYLWDDSYGEVPAEVTEITKITTEQAKSGEHPRTMLEKFIATIPAFDYVVAHNGNGYDKPLLEAEALRWGLSLPLAKWMDTMTDFPYPEKNKCRRLSHICLDHGIVVDPSILHGAVGDTELLEKLVSKYILNLEQVAKISQAPFLAIQALVEYATKELAKAQSFRWNPDLVDFRTKRKGIWTKQIRDFELPIELEKAAKAGFKIKQLE